VVPGLQAFFDLDDQVGYWQGETPPGGDGER
jgi:hypothetical protein